MYKVFLEPRVIKQINSVHPIDRKKATAALDKLSSMFSQPERAPNLKKLSAEEHAWRLRVGDVRILFYQNKNAQRLEVYKVGYRGGVYKN